MSRFKWWHLLCPTIALLVKCCCNHSLDRRYLRMQTAARCGLVNCLAFRSSLDHNKYWMYFVSNTLKFPMKVSSVGYDWSHPSSVNSHARSVFSGLQVDTVCAMTHYWACFHKTCKWAWISSCGNVLVISHNSLSNTYFSQNSFYM